MADSMSRVQIVPKNTNTTFSSEQDPTELGSWYWYKNGSDDDEDEGEESLGCIVAMGSNYVEVEGLSKTCASGGWTSRIHLSEFDQKLRPCDDAHAVIEEYQEGYRSKVQALLIEVKAVTARLGVSNQTSIDEKKASDNSTALTVMTNIVDTKKYSSTLEKAAKETLPDLFEKIKDNSDMLAHWMLAETIPLKAQCGNLDAIIKSVQDRIFNVKIYAGLAEAVHHFAQGKPADFNAPLHVFENRLYMDEECLIGYDTGGADCDDIDGFNQWLAKPENRDRLLPYDRCLVTFRVRRLKKEYGVPRSISDIFAIMQRDQKNMETFIYIRNGENLYEIGSELDFGDTIFNATSDFDPMEPLMFREYFRKFFFMGLNDYESRCEEDDKYRVRRDREDVERKAYYKSIPKKPDQRTKKGRAAYEEWSDLKDNAPYGGSWHRTEKVKGERRFENRGDFNKFNKDNVYYDDALAYMNEETKRYNRLAMIIQGIFDRSKILHPHPPVQVWEEESFKRSVKLVYDASANLYSGEKPDVDAYMKKNREGFSVDSIFMGQQDHWERAMAKKENERRDNSYRDYDRSHVDKFKPYGNPGPTNTTKPERWQTQKRVAVFSWVRERIKYDCYNDNPIRTTCTVPEKYLFDLTQYKRNDYKIFLQDPRTRVDYMEWAEQLIMGELYLDGKLDIAIPIGKV